MPTIKQFEDLRIWQESRILVKQIYNVFGKGSKGERDYGFRDQIQRASVSIINNISEGFERDSDMDFARFLDIAKGSCGEVRSLLYVAEDLEYLTLEEAEKMRDSTVSISKGIATLTKHLRKH